MAKSHAPSAFPAFARYGCDILVMWDDADEATDPYLHAAVLLGLALASRQRRPDDAGDLEALADIEHRIQKELERLGKMRGHIETIQSAAEKLGDDVRKGEKALGVLLRNAKSTLKALKVELTEAEDAQVTPVLLPAGSLANARAAFVEGPANSGEAGSERKMA